MRLTKLGVTLGLAVAVAPSAFAGDLSYGGSIKDRGGVPIPAPIPIADTFKWYVRADVGVGFMSGGDISPSGNTFGMDRDPLNGSPFGMSSAWFTRDGDTKMIGGVGVGAYLTPRIRTDATVDFRTKSDVDGSGTYTYQAIPPSPGSVTQVDGRVSDKSTLHSTLLLANLYYDLTERGSRFVPYVGVGVGAALHSLHRESTTGEILTDITDPLNPSTLGTRTLTGNNRSIAAAPAAAAMVGFAYNLQQGIVLDVGYRFAYMGSVDFSTPINYSTPINNFTGANSKLGVGDMFEHSIRAGVRWNVW